MRITTLLVSLAFLVGLAGGPPGADACSCARAGSPCEAFGGATAVFIGSVISSEQVESGMNYVIRPEKTFKGSPGGLTLFFSCFECMCGWGYKFSVGERYLVYAFYRDSSGMWGAGACGRTRPLAEANEDLEYLQSLPEGSGGRLYGSFTGIDSDRKVPLVGVLVTVEGESQSYTTTTDVNEQYEISGIIPGEYQVSFKVMEGTNEFDGYMRRAYVYDRGCSRLNFLCIRDEAHRRYSYPSDRWDPPKP